MGIWRKVTGTVLVDGRPEPNVRVYFYEPGTTNPIPVYEDEGTTAADNPQLTDAAGRYAIYVDASVYPKLRIYLEKDGVDFSEANADLDGVPVPGGVVVGGATTLDGLEDVETGSPSDGALLIYDGESGKWVSTDELDLGSF